MTPAKVRPLARADLVERTRYYRREAGRDVAARFFDTAIDTLHALEKMPRTGSPRATDLSSIPGLRLQRIRGFPCGWFYLIRPDHLDVVRLLSDSQDLSAILDE